VVHLSPALAGWLGLADLAPGRCAAVDIIRKYMVAADAERLLAALARGEPIRGAQARVFGVSRRIRWLSVSADPRFAQDGRFDGFSGHLRDITERRLFRQRLRKTRGLLRESQALARIGSWALDLRNNHLSWSDETFRIFEIDQKKFGASYEAFLELVHPEDRAVVDACYRRSVEERTPYSVIHRLLMPEGRVKYVHERGQTFYDEAGEPLRSIGTVQDVTEEHLRAEELHRLSQAIEQSAAMIAILTADGRYHYVNRAWCEATGYPPDEVIGATPGLIKSGATPNTVYGSLWQALRAGQSWTGEILNRKKSGEFFWCREILSPMRDRVGKITHFVAVMEDVTPQRRAAEELRRAKEAAEAANKTKSLFLANVNHELRTPLNAVMGFADLLQNECHGPLGAPEYRSYAAEILKAGRMLLGLVEDLMHVASAQAGRPLKEEDIDLIAMTEEVIGMLRQQASGKNIHIAAAHAPRAPLLRADPRGIRQILTNLVSNALQCTPPGGHVMVTLDQAPSGGLRIAVRDTGIGIAPEHLKQVFTPFFQAETGFSRQQQGIELGLSICKALVDAHGGSMSVSSRPGQGTTVTVEFPRERRVMPAPAAFAAASDGRPSSAA
jgi:PAS domain S-box-containing protein